MLLEAMMARRADLFLSGGDPAVRRDDPEPSVYALLDDPVAKLMMKSDGIHRTEMLYAIEVARMRLRMRGRSPRAFTAVPHAQECRL